MSKDNKNLHSQNIIACVWDFDQTLIPGYMQAPIFQHYNIDEKLFWHEVNQLPEIYKKRGVTVSKDTVYLNHLLSYIKNGPLKGFNNQKLRELGQNLSFYQGLPDFFKDLQTFIDLNNDYKRHDIILEHYIISTGLAEMIRGSKIAPFVENIYGCEFIENPLPPGFSTQKDFLATHVFEISQIGVMVDNTIKTRFIFEINKGSNKHPTIDVNAKMHPEDRRIPINNMIYIADGPSDIPVFAVIKDHGGKTYAVYDPKNPDEFAQNDRLLQSGRIHAYGPADYCSTSSTAMWIKMHITEIAKRIVKEKEEALAHRLAKPPIHLHKNTTPTSQLVKTFEQSELL